MPLHPFLLPSAKTSLLHGKKLRVLMMKLVTQMLFQLHGSTPCLQMVHHNAYVSDRHDRHLDGCS